MIRIPGYHVHFHKLNSSTICSWFLGIIKKNNINYRHKACFRRMSYVSKSYFIYQITDITFKTKVTGIVLMDEKIYRPLSLIKTV